ncbi:quinone oxidoreductase family protein [Terriglobus saanensis]|uniref:Alcohol dehydrogenase zinc-binding domain protein n=1 Tax=Terriglobus saanensis (strain ATCC BAA-1853 / DSM 23119 / SP1PR4) TaxID=401053 RepID=E8V085_TERSS|nr:zinc-binding alcohol dehydrogenase family protein [Terriglobus saanensis]ADV83303.1 Alcohol dehydrogenase zinc-binding domain protein [Terriglobus saanensis SP1PR4]
MKAAIVTAAGKMPVYGDFQTPNAQAGEELITVRASALSHFSKSRASGSHYSSGGVFPLVAGSDGVGITQDGRRVYFVLPDAPFGALAEFCPVNSRRCIELPDSLNDVTAAAIANPGMSAWAALVERAHLVAGETVLINGATGTAGRLAVQLAKYLGAAKVIATGRNMEELEQLGADVVIPFTLGMLHPSGAKDYEEALKKVFASGIHVVIDYLWGESAKTIIVAIAKAVEDGTPVRFVHVGGSSGEENIDLPGAALRSSAILLMGSGVGSVPQSVLLQAIKNVFDAVQPAGLKIATTVVPLSKVEEVWDKAPGKPRVVFSMK